MVVVFAAAVVAVIWAASPQFMYLLVGDEKEVVLIGVCCLHIVSLTFPFCVSLYLLTNFLRGAGEIVYPVFNTMLELGVPYSLCFCFGAVYRVLWNHALQTIEFSYKYGQSVLPVFHKKMAGTIRDKTF